MTKYYSPQGKRIADYVWLDKTQRSWHIWSGNPLCIGLQIIPLKELTEERIIAEAKRITKLIKKRFTKDFPNIKWETME
jgi:hypothetical protein